MRASIRGARRRRDPGRYASSVVVSLTLHAIAAALLAIYIVAREVPRLLEQTAPILVSFWRAEPRRAAPPPPRPPAEDEPEPAVETVVALGPPKPSAAPGTLTVAPGSQTSRSGAAAQGRVAQPRDLAPTHAAASATGSVPVGQPGHTVHAAFTAFADLAHEAPGEVVPVSLPDGAELDSDPTDVRARGGYFSSGRGLGAGNAAGGGGYGSGGGGGSRTGVYSGLMRGLARGLIASTSSEELDIVFIVDTTHSMIDNVRGVTAYADEFVDLLRWDGRNPRFGLVTFSDTIREPAKARGMTSTSGDFRNWLHAITFTGGGAIAESGLDAVMTGAQKLKFRKKSHRYFVFVSDGPFHDRDYNGQSEYTLDEVIRDLQERRVVVDVVGIDFLPVMQLAWGTGGRWLRIPGKGYLEQVAPPLPVKANAALGVLSTKAAGPRDEIHVFPDADHPPEWYELRWRLLNPRGEKIRGEFVVRQEPAAAARRLTFAPKFDERWFGGSYGYYTAIYRITDSAGKSSVLRRVMDYR